MVYHIKNKEDLDRVIENAGDKLVVIDFYASWCGPCKIITPKLEELAEKHKERTIVVKVDVDDCEDIATEYDISSMPTFVFVKNKKTLEMFVGGNSEKLEKNFENLVSDMVDNNNAVIKAADDDVVAGAVKEQEDALVSVDG